MAAGNALSTRPFEPGVEVGLGDASPHFRIARERPDVLMRREWTGGRLTVPLDRLRRHHLSANAET